VSATCPNGHVSATEDYCDQCGARIAAATTPPPAGAPSAPGAPVERETCPRCGTARTGDDRYCEGCGYDFANPPAPGDWEAVASADRAMFDRLAPAGVSFPESYNERRFALTGDYVRIGRNRAQDAVEVNLAGTPEDPAISHEHAVLERQPDGSYNLRDLGSTNGTTVNDDLAPVSTEASAAVPLADGDRIHMGAWTTLTVRRSGSG
jgi:hypothetical protein